MNIYLSGDLIGPDWVLVRSFPVAEEVSKENEREWDAEPHCSHSEHGGEGDCTARVFAPDKQVDEEADTEHEGRVESGREQRRRLPRQVLYDY